MSNLKSSYDRVKKHRALKRRLILVSSSSSSDESENTIYVDNAKNRNQNQSVQCSASTSPPASKELSELSEENASLSPYIRSDASTTNSPNITSNEDDNVPARIGTTDESVVASGNSGSDNSSVDFFNDCDNLSDDSENGVAQPNNISSKLRAWALANIGTINHKCLSELLVILRSEGFTNLPKAATTLLRTNVANYRIEPMLCSSGTDGEFVYFGLENGLNRIILPEIYTENEIRILVNIDGLPIYRNSRKQFWPILAQVFHKNYDAHPFVVGIYCGDSKPLSANDYLQRFIDEIITLMTNGVTIQEKTYRFEIAAFVCDTPARAFIKRCKGHGGFYACERCSLKGRTVEKKRVYADIDAAERTRESFIEKTQPEHHVGDGTSPLLDIPGFDPVKSVLLDKMHLMSGVMKSLIEKMGSGKNRVKPASRLLLSDLLKYMTPDIPLEFQRKKYVLKDVADWKATQFSFVLLYCGALVFRRILPPDKYKHFLLLFVSCRILCSSQLAVVHADYAKTLLRKFFVLMTTLYGSDSQVINFHNLIHVADDVKHMNAPLTEFAAFSFENTLGKLKKLVRAPQNPLAQVARRLCELHSGRDPDGEPIRPQCPFSDYVRKRTDSVAGIVSMAQRRQTEYFQIRVNQMFLRTSHPDNIVQMQNGAVIKITKIFTLFNHGLRLDTILLEGHEMTQHGDAFAYPCPSSHVGVIRIGVAKKPKNIYRANTISKKCIALTVSGNVFAITMLHL